MKRVTYLVREHALRVDAILFVLVLVHATLALLGVIPDVWGGLGISETSRQAAQDIFTAFPGVAAIVAGFAGVVVIFALSGTSDRFVRFRATAGASLRSTWVSSSVSGFLAAALGVSAALVSAAGFLPWAAYLFEAAALLLVHGSARLLWILGKLVGLVSVDDAKRVDELNRVKIEALPRVTPKRESKR